MAAIVTVSDGNVIIDDDVNQLVSTLSAVVGVTDTAQDALGRMVFPKSTSAPGTPSTAMFYMKTDEGVESAGGRLYGRQAKNGSGAAVWVPYLPLRQRVAGAAIISGTITGTSYADITDATLNITTTGGRLRIFVEGDVTSGYSLSILGDGTSSIFAIKALVGATSAGEATLGATTPSLALQCNWPEFSAQPVAGTYTVKLQGKITHSGEVLIPAGRLVVIEYGDS